MADIMDFSPYARKPDLDAMSREELLECLQDVWGRIGQLDMQEPEVMDSEEYDAWGNCHEALEDLVDEIMDLLDEGGEGGD